MLETTSGYASKSKRVRKNQLPYGIALFAILIGLGLFLANISLKLSFFWLTGIAFGFVLQKSRFCFTSAMRDPYLTGSTSLTKAVLIALAVTTIGFTAIKYGAFTSGKPIPGQSYITPISFATVVGGLMFGIGMVIAGGCSCGTLMRVGEGFAMQLITLIFLIIGSLWGAHDYGWWEAYFIDKGKSVFLPEILGWFGAVSAQLFLIAALYIAAVKWENRNQDF